MASGRQDGWTADEDTLLAEVVLRHVREGSTQLKGFEEVGERLSRTAAACGFRWNSFVRKQYKEAIEVAKKNRRLVVPKASRNLKRTEVTNRIDDEHHSLEECIDYLQRLQLQLDSYPIQRVQSLAKENEFLHARVDDLIRERDSYKQSLNEVSDDYQLLIRIFDKARRLAINETEEERKIKFQMDQNGNLERV